MQIETGLPKVYLSFPKPFQKISRIKRVSFALLGFFLAPIYWGLSYFTQTPGLSFRCLCALKGFGLLFKKRDFVFAHNLIVTPMDSVRYFEFDFMWRAIKKNKAKKYLDVSSPRLLPLMILNQRSDLDAILLNPDKSDLPVTEAMAKAFGVDGRCNFISTLIEKASLTANSFDLITSMSVIEHIPDDKGAIQKMWDLLRPGGVLLITVPCAAKASEEYTNLNDYGLIREDERGFVFWQRYYDESLISEKIYSITGPPKRAQIFAEKIAGNYNQNVMEKRSNQFYPYWREPLMTGRQYQIMNGLAKLPGMGVIAMEFVKPGNVQETILTKGNSL